MPRWNKLSSSLGFAYISVLGLASACSFGDFDSLSAGRPLNVGGSGGSGGSAGSAGTAGNAGTGGTGISGSGGTGGNGGSGGQGGTAGEPVNLISNADFEQSSLNWGPLGGCVVERVQDDPYSGDNCLLARNRTARWHGPAFNMLRKGEPGATYNASVWVRGDASDIPDGGSVPIQLTHKATCTSTSPSGAYTPLFTGELTTEWIELAAAFTYPDCPDLTEFVVYVEEPNPNGIQEEPTPRINIYLDDTSITLAE